MRSMSEGRWFCVFLEQFNENERNAESGQQDRWSIPGADGLRSPKVSAHDLLIFYLARAKIMIVIWRGSFQLTSMCGAVGEATEVHRTKK